MSRSPQTVVRRHQPLFGWGWIYVICLRPLGRVVRGIVEKATGERWSGSDAFADYTANYTWFANQFGHSTIGLFFGLLSWVAASFFTDLRAESAWVTPLVITVVLCVFYGAKEAADYMTEVEGAAVDGATVARPFFDHKDLHDRYLTEIRADAEADALFVVLGAALGWAAALTVAGPQGIGWSAWALVLTAVAWAAWAAFSFKRYIPFMKRRDRAGFRAYGRLARLQESFAWKRDEGTVDIAAEINTLVNKAVAASNSGSAPYAVIIEGSPGARALAFVNAIAGDAMWAGANALYLDRSRAGMSNRPPERRAILAKESGLVCLDDFVGWKGFQEDLKRRLKDCVVVATAAPDRAEEVRANLEQIGVSVASVITLSNLDEP